jgi:membrane-bound lytic murein transglycosylase D
MDKLINHTIYISKKEKQRFAIPFFVAVCLLMAASGKANWQIVFHKNNLNDTTVKGFKNLLSQTDDANLEQGRFAIDARVMPYVTAFLNQQGNNYEQMKNWGKPYFTLYENILTSHNIPIQLKYLSVIESSLQAGAVSYAGAVGPWQLMPYEAKRFGLIVTDRIDERTSFIKSTEAAAKLITELYKQFGDWLLVIAAYNAGAGAVSRAIGKAHSTNFWELQYFLPEQTRLHVKRYIAAHYFFEGSGGWTTLTAAETLEKRTALSVLQSKPDTLAFANTAILPITGKFNSLIISNHITMDIARFNQLNPGFDKIITEGKTYQLRLPADKMDLFKARRQQILFESVQLMLSTGSTGGVSNTAKK